MKQINKKAAECTAIHPTAKKYTLDCASKIIGISADDFTGFMLYRQYIQKEGNKIIPTAMGLDFGYMVKDSESNAMLTTKGLIRFSKAFDAIKKSC